MSQTQQSKEVLREPWSPEDDIRHVEEAFQFNNEPTEAQKVAMQHLEDWGKAFAIELAGILPEGTAKQIALNNVLGAVVWAKQSMTQNTVVMGSTSSDGPRGNVGCCGGAPGVESPVPCCERDHNGDGNCDVHQA